MTVAGQPAGEARACPADRAIALASHILVAYSRGLAWPHILGGQKIIIRPQTIKTDKIAIGKLLVVLVLCFGYFATIK